MRLRKRTSLIALVLWIGCVIAVGPVAAQQTKTMTFNADDAFIVPGLMVLILQDEKNLKVEMVPPTDQLPKEYRDLDLQQGDLILMFNGKRVKTIEALRGRYDSLAVADSVQFGIKRGQEMRIVSFLKPGEEIQGGGRMMMVSKEIGDGEALQEGGTKVKMMGSGEGPEPIVALDAGVILSEKDGNVEVMVVVTNAEADLTGEPMKEGDRVVSIQGTKVTSADEFRKRYDAIPVGTKAELVYTRNGVEHQLQFVKAKAENVMMKKSTQP